MAFVDGFSGHQDDSALRVSAAQAPWEDVAKIPSFAACMWLHFALTSTVVSSNPRRFTYPRPTSIPQFAHPQVCTELLQRNFSKTPEGPSWPHLVGW